MTNDPQLEAFKRFMCGRAENAYRAKDGSIVVPRANDEEQEDV